MEKINVKGTVVGTSQGKSKAGNPYTLVTAVIGGKPMTLRFDPDLGSLTEVVPMTEQTLVLSLDAYRTEARVGFLGAQRKAA